MKNGNYGRAQRGVLPIANSLQANQHNKCQGVCWELGAMSDPVSALLRILAAATNECAPLNTLHVGHFYPSFRQAGFVMRFQTLNSVFLGQRWQIECKISPARMWPPQ